MDAESARKYLDDVLSNVRQYGWFCQGITGDDDHPACCYTIGLTQSYNHPELAIFGLKSEIMLQILANAVEGIKEGRGFKDGDEADDIIKNYNMAFREAPPPTHEEYFGVAVRFNNWKPFDMLQVFWPDRAGLFPWEDGFESGFLHAQPQLWRDKETR
jgi:hypothetical protein